MNPYLEPVDDGLYMRPSGRWAKKKLSVLAHYIATSTTAMKDRPWRRRFYIDLQAGSGKNIIRRTRTAQVDSDVFLGSPLLALTGGAGFTDYFFVEMNPVKASVLKQRCLSVEDRGRIHVMIDDCNTAVDQIAAHIEQIDSLPYSKTNWTSLSLAFLDPEGLELNWKSVERLASLNRTDLIINFSTGGLRRHAKKAWSIQPGEARADLFFGTTDWRSITRKPDGSMPVHEWIEFYRQRVTKLGYAHWGTDINVKNSKGVELYRLLFASKHELGAKLWEEARKNAPVQRSLF